MEKRYCEEENNKGKEAPDSKKVPEIKNDKPIRTYPPGRVPSGWWVFY